jgi:transposase-like protein
MDHLIRHWRLRVAGFVMGGVWRQRDGDERMAIKRFAKAQIIEGVLKSCAAACPRARKRYLFIMNADCTVPAPPTHRVRHPLALRLQCRKEWVEGQGTIAEIAKKHGVPESTVIAWYRRDNWTASRNRWLAKQLSDNEPPASPPSYAPNPKITTNAHAEKLALKIAAIDNQIDNAKSALELQRFCAARRNLFEQWCVLAQIPKLGSRRSGKERQQLQSWDFPMPDAVECVAKPHDPDEPKPLLTPAA